MYYTTPKFLSTPSARRATLRQRPEHLPLRISIHALREEGDFSRCQELRRRRYFYPRPPRGGRPIRSMCCSPGVYFYPRPPRGGRRGRCGCIRLILLFLSTPSARRATECVGTPCRALQISIHALREEGDGTVPPGKSSKSYFYPRPPRGGRPVRPVLVYLCVYFYPRPPRGGRRAAGVVLVQRGRISIHALREEGDQESRRQSRPE